MSLFNRDQLDGEENERVRAALIELCLERGYAALDVETLCRRAGVDRTDFELCYADLDQCFCEVYAAEFGRYRAAAEAARAGLPDWRDRLRATAYALHGYLAEDQRVTHFTVVEVRRGPERARLLLGEGIEELIDLLDEGRRQPGAPAGLTRSTAESLAGSIFTNLYLAVSHGETPADPDPIAEFMYAAVMPYLGPAVAREELEMPPPRGSLGSAPPAPRDALHRALIDLCFERGYAALDVEALCGRAGVERRDFEREFADLDQCFSAVFESEMDRLLLELDTLLAEARGFRERLRVVAYAFSDWLAEDRARTHLMVTEIRTGPEAARLIQARGIERMVALLDEGRRRGPVEEPITRATAESLAGGILIQLSAAVAEGREIRRDLVPEMLYAALLPYVGPEAAAQELATPPPAATGGEK